MNLKSFKDMKVTKELVAVWTEERLMFEYNNLASVVQELEKRAEEESRHSNYASSMSSVESNPKHREYRLEESDRAFMKASELRNKASVNRKEMEIIRAELDRR